MFNISKVKKFIKYEDYLLCDYNGQIIQSGDVLYHISPVRPNIYFIVEYVKYADSIILIAYSKNISYHSLPMEKNARDNISFYYKNSAFFIDPSTNRLNSYIVDFKEQPANISKDEFLFIKKMSRAIGYRSNWNTLPILTSDNVSYFSNIVIKQNTSSYVKLSYKNYHEEYLWKY